MKALITLPEQHLLMVEVFTNVMCNRCAEATIACGPNVLRTMVII